ncbi:TPA: rRNA maturation RNase YbeY [Candidatus Dependentiae bacterium]|nr:MAG: hypothetical protein UR14_C0004G0087 [candidate division TM6 bacterium GW2011_GWE2_31_21]KKP53007.1 MAG: hypothetical protein UR43_C0008G0089 [candidate division TM6 bacterium GW2011_GWF2_33_332]HBS47756.1 rRNA maturation RNase YbeY [Candidatus Dependentiae bacterium]HBZ73268.1 rRNA maturation RNase YbeY [Candidatus Dependentiae bacterium]
MIFIKNSQKKIKIDINKIEQKLQKLLNFLKMKDFDVSLWFTTDTTIRKFNKKYRKKDKATDILSFPYHVHLKPGQKIEIKTEEDNNLGDIIISLKFVKKHSELDGVDFNLYINILLVHGIAHLLGYDHETDSDFKVMQKFEKSLLSEICGKN